MNNNDQSKVVFKDNHDKLTILPCEKLELNQIVFYNKREQRLYINLKSFDLAVKYYLHTFL